MTNTLLGVTLAAGLPDSFGGLVAIGAMIVLGLMLAALGSYGYKQLRGDGIEWPDDPDESGEENGLQHGDDDDEWDYY